MGIAAGVLMHCDQRRHAAALEIFAAHGMARALGRHHQHVQVWARLDQLEMDIEAMGEQQGRPLLHVVFQLVLVDVGLQLVGRGHHHHIGPFGGIRHAHHLEAGGFRLLGRRAGANRDHQFLDARVAHVLGMGMALGAKTDDGDLLVLDQIEIGIPIVIDAHFLLPFLSWPASCGPSIFETNHCPQLDGPQSGGHGSEGMTYIASGPREMAATPVRDTSTSPSGRISSTKLSILAGAPVISNTKLEWVVSTGRARKASAMRSASTRFSPVPATLISAISRSIPALADVQLVTLWVGTRRRNCASICSITSGVPVVTMVMRLGRAIGATSATVRLSILE